MFKNIKNIKKISYQNIILIILGIILIYCFANDYIFDRKDKFFNLKDFRKHLNKELDDLEKEKIIDELGPSGYSLKINEKDVNFKNSDTENAIHDFWFTASTTTTPSTERNYVFFSSTSNPNQFLKLNLNSSGPPLELADIGQPSNTTLPYYLLEEISNGSGLKFYNSDNYISSSSGNVSISTSLTNPVNIIRFNNKYCNITINSLYLNVNTPVSGTTYTLRLDSTQRAVPQFRRIELCDPMMLNYDAEFYHKELNISTTSTGMNINLQTLCEYKNNNYRFRNKTLRELSLTSDFNEKLHNYVNSGISKVDSTLNNISDYLDITSNDPERLINRIYVQNVLDYKDFREDLMNKSAFQNTENKVNNMTKVSTTDDGTEKNLPGFDLLSGSENMLLSKDAINNLFPQNPEDFYGLYIVKFSDFALLENIKIIYNNSNFKIISKDNKNIFNFAVKESKKLTIPEFPNQTIQINLKKMYTHSDKYDDLEELIMGKQRKLLEKIGINNAVYLFGNDGKYSLYNLNRNKLFNLIKLEEN